MSNEINVLSCHIFLNGNIKILIRPTKYKINLSRRNCFSDCAYHSSKCIMLFLPPPPPSSLILTFFVIHRFLAPNLAMAIFQTMATRRRVHASAGKRRNACKAAVLYPSICFNTTLLVYFELCRNQFLLRYVRLCS